MEEIKMDFDELKTNKKSNGNDKTAHQSPQLFGNIFVEKTLKLFYPGYEGKRVSKRSFKENLWWFFITFIAFIIAASFLCKALLRYKISPTFTSIILNDINMKVSYPTIDVCPLQAIDGNKISKIIENFTNDTLQHKNDITEIIPNFITQLSGHIQTFNATILKKISEYLKSDDLRIMTFKLTIECRDLIRECKYKGQPIDCCLHFLPRLSEHGFCYSFNSKIYGTTFNDFKNPQIMSIFEFEDHTLNFEISQPSKVFMHSRDEHLSRYHKEVITTNQSEHTSILFSIRQTHTSDDLREFHANFRKCYYKNERKSKMYANEDYTYSGCLRDLVIEEFQSACGCIVPYYRPTDLDNVTFCGFSDLKCLTETAELLRRNEKFLDCYLPCENAVYAPEKIDSFMLKNSSKITFNLHQWPLISLYRELRFEFLDFVVTFGSIFALFLGFSLLSLVEILLSIIKFLSKKFIATKSEARN